MTVNRCLRQWNTAKEQSDLAIQSEAATIAEFIDLVGRVEPAGSTSCNARITRDTPGTQKIGDPSTLSARRATWRFGANSEALHATLAFLGTDLTITSGSLVIRAVQRPLGRFGKLCAARCCI